MTSLAYFNDFCPVENNELALFRRFLAVFRVFLLFNHSKINYTNFVKQIIFRNITRTMLDIEPFKFLCNNWSRPNQFLVSETVSGRGQKVSVFVPNCPNPYGLKGKIVPGAVPTQRPFGKLVYS